MLSQPAGYPSSGNVFQPDTPDAFPHLHHEIAVVEDEEQWAANPWQAQVDAHIMQLQQAGATFPQVLNNSSSSSAHTQRIGTTVNTNPALCSSVHGSPAVLGGVFVATPTPQLAVKEDLLKRNAELEGTIALLEESLLKKDIELAEAVRLQLRGSLELGRSSAHSHNTACGEESMSTKGLMAEVLELRRRNEFLSTVVTRFEGKTMTLEKEIETLTLQKEEAGQLHHVNDLEGQIALLEDVIARKDGELEDLRKRLSSEELERKKREKQTRLDAVAREDTAKLKEEVEFLLDVIRRFERKTMDMETQLELLSKVKEQCLGNEKALEVCHQELDIARAVAADHEAKEIAERSLCHELQQAQSEAEERLEQERRAAESATLSLRDYKKDHNQRMQELLRKTQMLEKQKRDVEVELVAAKETIAAAEKLARLKAGSEEVEELRVLNKQLVERLGKERAEHSQSKENLAKALEALDHEKADHLQTKLSSSEVSQDNESLSIRLEYLVGQLYELATRNDALQAEVLAAEEERKRLNFDADLDLMS